VSPTSGPEPTLESLRKVRFFQGLADEHLAVLIERLEPRAVGDGEVIFQEGDVWEGLYVVASGEVVISKLLDERQGMRRWLSSITDGETMCELALLYREPSLVSARAHDPAALWVLTREAYQALQRSHPATAAGLLSRLLHVMRTRLQESTGNVSTLYEETELRIEKLKAIPLFSKLDPTELGQVAAIIQWCDVPAGATIFREGERGDRMYIIEEGVAEVSKLIDQESGAEKILAVVTKGAFFGDMSLLDDEPRSATVRARGPLRLLVLERDTFRTLLAGSAPLASKILFGVLHTTVVRLRRCSKDLVTFYDVGKLVGSITDATELATAIVHRVCETLGADLGAVVIRSPYAGNVQVRSSIGVGPAFGAEGLEGGLVGHALTLEQAADLTALLADPSMDRNGLEAASLVAAPLVVGGSVIGAFLVGRSQPGRPFVADDIQLLASVATQAAAAVENARRREEEQALQDHRRTFIGY
jgi:CRP-like cAMP-binding protein